MAPVFHVFHVFHVSLRTSCQLFPVVSVCFNEPAARYATSVSFSFNAPKGPVRVNTS